MTYFVLESERVARAFGVGAFRLQSSLPIGHRRTYAGFGEGCLVTWEMEQDGTLTSITLAKGVLYCAVFLTSRGWKCDFSPYFSPLLNQRMATALRQLGFEETSVFAYLEHQEEESAESNPLLSSIPNE